MLIKSKIQVDSNFVYRDKKIETFLSLIYMYLYIFMYIRDIIYTHTHT